MLGQINSLCSKDPDPVHLRSLMEFPIPTDAKSQKRPLGFPAITPNGSIIRENQATAEVYVTKTISFAKSTYLYNQGTKSLNKRSRIIITYQEFRPLLQETDASQSVNGSALSQVGRRLALFSRALTSTEQTHLIVAKEAQVTVKFFKNFAVFIKAFPARSLYRAEKFLSYSQIAN